MPVYFLTNEDKSDILSQIDDIKNEGGASGGDGFSPTAFVDQTDDGAIISITDKNGTTTATVVNGKDGKDGYTPVKDKDYSDGADGVSATHSWSGTVLTVTSASGTSSANLKGDKGDRGDKGDSYVLTPADKAEIAEQVESANIILSPIYVDSIDKMTDTSRVYVLSSTGHIYAYMDTTTTGTITEQIEGEFYDDTRLGSDGSNATDYEGYVTTPYIDLQAYPIPYTLHLDGAKFITEEEETYTRMCTYTSDKTKITCLQHLSTGIDSLLNVNDNNVSIDSDGNSTILFTQPITTNSGAAVQYARFSGKGTSDAAKIYATYTGVITGGQWIDTGTTYAPILTEADKQEIAEDVAAMIDSQLLTMVGDGAVTV